MPVIRALMAAAAAAAALSTPTNPPAHHPAPLVKFGERTPMGNGTVRAYVSIDPRTKRPTELGVAFTEGALDQLPTDGAGHHGQTGKVHQWSLALPTAAAPFRFVEVNWNPQGHEPAGVYEGHPHFDFHFYTVSPADRDAIVPTDPEYAAKANRLPTGDFVPPFTVQLGPPGAKPADVAVPKMGVHWVDLRSSELQALLGKPDAYKPFTNTFIVGSWDGRFTFWEPMITRAHMLAKKSATDAAVQNEVVPIAVPAKYAAPGAYPTAYRIAFDPKTREYRVALTNLVERH